MVEGKKKEKILEFKCNPYPGDPKRINWLGWGFWLSGGFRNRYTQCVTGIDVTMIIFTTVTL